MRKMVRTAAVIAASLALASTMALAAGSGRSDNKDTKKEHHSRLAKAAFWRHLKKDKDAKKAEAKPEAAKPAPAKVAQVKTPSKPAARNRSSEKRHVSSVRKPAVKKAPARKLAKSNTAGTQHVARAHAPVKHRSTAKTKPQSKAEHRTTASLQQ